MLQRYLGNKTVLMESILRLVAQRASPGAVVCDPFSGSVAVSHALKQAGYRVATNDINLLSWIYAVAFAGQTDWPEIKVGLATRIRLSTATTRRQAWQNLLDRTLRNSPSDIPKRYRRTDIYDHYCEEGKLSGFLSSRGSSGRRRFFSPANAQKIDAAFSRLRWWWKEGLIDTPARCLLTAILLDAIEKVSNTQGTYHDFPRDQMDPRSKQALRPVLPPDAIFTGPVPAAIGRAEDSLDFVRRVPRHEVLYLDPPYNFRQYTAYYFLPNLLARYPEIDDLDAYFAAVQHVRGQNMSDDFTSSFCKAREFLPSLRTLIERADCRHVILSYFDGKNHWSDFKEHSDRRGRSEIERFLKSDLFEKRSMRCFPILRQNYQSYGGYQAVEVKEFLFVAEKRETVRTEVAPPLVAVG